MQISENILYRLGGISALVGGILRVISSFIPYREETAWLEGLYGLIDICLLFGLTAIYLKHARKVGGFGLLAFIFSATGIASIVGPDAILFGIDFYQTGALLIMVGLTLLSIQLLRNNILIWPSSLWIASFILSILGLALSFPWLFVGAGVSFGIAFTWAGSSIVLTQCKRA